MAIEGSHLYNVLSARWEGHHLWPSVLVQLNHAHEHLGERMNLEKESIFSAFTWMNSPQGIRYWEPISGIDQELTGDPRAQAVKKKETVYAAEYR